MPTAFLNEDFGCLTVDDRSVNLTRKEFLTVKYLMENPGFIRSRNQIIDTVYGINFAIEDRTVDTMVKRIRRKVRPLGYDPIETRSGFGYSWKLITNSV